MLETHTRLCRRLLVWASLSSLIGLCFAASAWLLHPAVSWAPLLALALAVKLATAWAFRLHLGWGTLIRPPELLRIWVVLAASSVAWAAAAFLVSRQPLPLALLVTDWLLLAASLSALRLLLELLLNEHRAAAHPHSPRKRVLIYGAGWSGAMLASELLDQPSLLYDVAGFIDDDPRKLHERVAGLPVWGAGSDLPRLASLPRGPGPLDLVLIAIPSARAAAMRAITAWCRDANLPCKTLPPLSDLLEGRGFGSQIRSVSLEDLLHRDPVELDSASIRSAITSRTILVTGAGGSIGSELCRRVAAFQPALLLMLDRAESDLFRIDLELAAAAPAVPRLPVIADIREPRTLEALFRSHAIDSIYHAAAYKHVPLMESHVPEAVANNVLGTWNLARAAARHGVSRFVMISTDKAVNPASVMGATKRAAELLITRLARLHPGSTLFLSVRFGNVLGSNGSVIPIFQAQIERGGPVTVTHPDMRRYFMTIREAALLVLQTAAIADSHGTFVLDMGEPVRIADLARNMIQLAGRTPGAGIPIVFTGVRPGEKLFEELNLSAELTFPTAHPKIRAYHPAPRHGVALPAWLARVRREVHLRNDAALVALLRELIPEYQPHPAEPAPRALAASSP